MVFVVTTPERKSESIFNAFPSTQEAALRQDPGKPEEEKKAAAELNVPP